MTEELTAKSVRNRKRHRFSVELIDQLQPQVQDKDAEWEFGQASAAHARL